MTDASPAPNALQLGAWLVACLGLTIETAAVVWTAVAAVFGELTGQASDAVAGIGVSLFLLMMAIALALVTVGVFRRRRWAIAPAITAQLFVGLAFGMPFLSAGQRLIGGALLVGAVIVLVCLVVLASAIPPARRFQAEGTASGS